jgi:chain length determinant protein EpsF
MNPHKFFLVLKARWKTAVSIFGAMVALALLVTFILPKQYTATAAVVIDAKSDPLAGLGYASEELLSGYIATQVDIIGSDRVVRAVVASMKLDQDPKLREKWRHSWDSQADIDSWLVAYLQKKISVTPSRDSSVINIAVEWNDAKFAASLANAFASAYIETNIELKVEPAKQYSVWFDQHSRVLRADLEAKQKRLSDYQTKTGIVATDEKLDIETARLGELSTQLVNIQGELQDSQSRQRQVNGDVDSIPEVLQSTVIGDLKSSLADAESREPDIASRLGKNHPDYQAAEAEIASLKRRIAQETSKIAASLGNNLQVNLRREADIRKALEAQKEKVLELRHQHDQVADLENDVTTAQRDLDAVTQHRAQSDLESQARQSNVVQLTAAVEPLKASSPKLLINLLLGIFLGMAAGLGTVLIKEIRQPLLREAEEMTELLGVPLLGHIGSATPLLRMASRNQAARLGQLAT